MSDQETGGAPAPVADANASQAKPATDVAAPKSGSEADSSPAAKSPSDKPAKPQESGEQLRIKELTRRLREAERRADRLLNVAEERGRVPTQPQAQPQPQTSSRKTLKDFNYDETAYSEHLVNEAANRAASVAEQKAREQTKQQAAATRRAAYDARAATFAQSVEDFDEVIRGEWACSEPMAEAIEESEEGPAVAFYLAKNPELSAKLAQLSPIQVGRELARIEDRLVAERKAASQKSVSQAPPPPPKVEGSEATNLERDPKKMTQKQFNKWREGFIGKRL